MMNAIQSALKNLNALIMNVTHLCQTQWPKILLEFYNFHLFGDW